MAAEDISITMICPCGAVTYILEVERDIQHAMRAAPASVVMEGNVARIAKLGVLHLEATEDLLTLS